MQILRQNRQQAASAGRGSGVVDLVPRALQAQNDGKALDACVARTRKLEESLVQVAGLGLDQSEAEGGGSKMDVRASLPSLGHLADICGRCTAHADNRRQGGGTGANGSVVREICGMGGAGG